MTSTQTDPTTQAAMVSLQNMWYNALVTGLGLDETRFQLLQPGAPVGDESDSIWAYFNNIPPLSLTDDFTAGGGNQFYSNYRGVISQLQSQLGDTFQRDIGDAWQPWQTYIGTVTPVPTLAQLPTLFQNWAAIHYPAVAQKGMNDLEAMANDPISLAQAAVGNQTQFINGIPNFSQGVQELTDAISRGSGGSAQLDSSTSSSDVENTWAKGEMGGVFDFFEGGGSVDYSSENEKAASSHVTVEATFAKAVPFAASPGSWYSSAAFGEAFNTPDNTLWNPGTPNWQSTFGPTGNMQRFVTEIVVVDGIDVTITSDASFSTSEQASLSANAEVGIWPFFEASASGGWSKDVTFDANGAMTVKITSVRGNPLVIGAYVVPAEKFLGGD